MTDWKTEYSAKYYAVYDNAALQPAPVTGWVDIGIFSSKPSWLPAASSMLALTTEQWNTRLSVGQAVKSNLLVAYPVLMQNAQATYKGASAAVATAYTAKGTAIPSDVSSYLAALLAIANGTDTTSTALPAQPADTVATTDTTSTTTTDTGTSSTTTAATSSAVTAK